MRRKLNFFFPLGCAGVLLLVLLWVSPPSENVPQKTTAAQADSSVRLPKQALPLPDQLLPSKSPRSPYQKQVDRGAGPLTRLVQARLREAMTDLRAKRQAPDPVLKRRPLPKPRAVDPALLPRPALLNEKQLANLAELRWRSGKQLHYRAFNRHGTINYIEGMMLEPPADVIGPNQSPEAATAWNFLKRNRVLLGLENPSEELVLEREEGDSLGYTQLHFRQTHGGLPVWPANLMVQIKPGGHASLLMGSYISSPTEIDRQPRIAEENAWAAARQAVGVLPGRPIEDSQLLIYAPQDAEPQLAYRVNLHRNMSEHWTVVVDAADGAVLSHYNHVCTAAVQGSGNDVSGTPQNLPLWEHTDGFFYMVDTTQPMYDATSNPPFLQNSRGVIKIVDANNQMPQGANVSYVDVRSNSATSGFSAEAVSASVNLGRVYNYFRQRFERNSIDGAGGSILGVVNVQMDNAFWNGSFIALGNLDTWADSLDFNAHEMSHGVISRTSNLVYQNQSGALNEAFADILGEGCEAHYAGGNLDWILGSGLSRGLRSMKDPASIPMIPGVATPYPKKMSEFLTVTHPDPNVANLVRNDSGGVHLNSSIINHAFYLLAEGLPGAIGLDESLQIFYRTVTTKLNPQSGFIDCRLGCVASAKELFGEGSPQVLKVAEAFDAVEIYDQQAPTMPAPIPTVNSQDNTLFTFTPDFNQQFLGRLELAQGDGQVGVQLGNVTVNVGSTPSVSGDGSFAVFVDSSFDVVLIDTLSGEGGPLGFAGQVYSVSVSADGSTLGFVFLDEFFNPSNRVSVVDIATNEAVEYDLAAPIFDQRGENTGSPILFAHVLDFTPDARFIYCDALNRIQLGSGYTEDLWSIYAIDQQTGDTYVVIPPISGVNIGNPSLGQAHNHFLVFEAEDALGVNYVYATDLVSGQINQIGAIAGGAVTPFIARPGYNGDDTEIVYTEYSFDPVFGWVPRADHLAMATNGIEAQGNAQIWLNTAVVGTPTVRSVIYRRGVYQGLPSVSVAATGAAASEAGETPGRFTLSRTGDTTAALNVSLVLTGSAENGIDYEATPLTIDIAPGQANAEVVIRPVDDALPEATEDVTLTITEATHYTIAEPSTATMTLEDNEAPLASDFASWANENGVGVSDFTGNPDKDAFVHLIEYGLGLDPAVPDGRGAVRVTTTDVNGEQFLTLRIQRRRKAPDVEYLAEVSPSLETGTWSSGEQAIVVLEDSETALVVRDRTPIGPASRLRAMRLRITKR